MELKDCAVVITGGASGMGAATARLLAKTGANVAIFDLNQAAGSELAAEINGLAFSCDVTKEDTILNALKAAKQQHGAARICINCAGIVHGRRLVNKQGPMSVEEFRKVIEVNLIGTFNMIRLTAAAMTELPLIGEERGVVINTASVAAYEGQIGQVAYSASKGGIVSLTLPAARELAASAIRVMTIAPGLVDTPMFQQIPEEARVALTEMVPFPKRLVQPEEYAMLVLQIIQNPMLNGEVIRLDGAIRMQPK